jgi:tRNA nucleotidyltransferase (CCA-adding enzyme)
MDHLISQLKALFPAPLHDRFFMVGGMVRDILMGIECQDIDLAAAVTPQQLLSLGFRLVESKSTPNIYFRYSHSLGKIEVTWLPSLEALDDDLRLRDFACNAIAMSLNGQLHDPLGGQPDLERRILRRCSPESLEKDPIRIFRAFRFECDGWRLDAETEAALAEGDWNAALDGIPIERFSQEMLKALAKPDPCRFFRRMLQFGIGKDLFPEIFTMAEIPAGPVEHHPEGDLFTHSMQTLKRMAETSCDVTARFCALLHDLGKLYTPAEMYPRHHGHDLLGAAQVPALCKRLRLPVVMQRALQGANKLHNTANRWEELRDSTRIDLALDAVKAGVTVILPLVVAADFGAQLVGWEKVLRVAALNSAQLGIDPAVFQGEPEKLQQVIMQRRVEELRRE